MLVQWWSGSGTVVDWCWYSGGRELVKWWTGAGTVVDWWWYNFRCMMPSCHIAPFLKSMPLNKGFLTDYPFFLRVLPLS